MIDFMRAVGHILTFVLDLKVIAGLIAFTILAFVGFGISTGRNDRRRANEIRAARPDLSGVRPGVPMGHAVPIEQRARVNDLRWQDSPQIPTELITAAGRTIGGGYVSDDVRRVIGDRMADEINARLGANEPFLWGGGHEHRDDVEDRARAVLAFDDDRRAGLLDPDDDRVPSQSVDTGHSEPDVTQPIPAATEDQATHGKTQRVEEQAGVSADSTGTE